MNPLAILLAISLIANAALGYAYLGQRDKATVAVVQEQHATGAAQECNKGTEQLETKAKERQAAAAPKIEAAKHKAKALDAQADQILTAPAAVPGDACASAQARLDRWWSTQEKL